MASANDRVDRRRAGSVYVRLPDGTHAQCDGGVSRAPAPSRDRPPIGRIEGRRYLFPHPGFAASRFGLDRRRGTLVGQRRKAHVRKHPPT